MDYSNYIAALRKREAARKRAFEQRREAAHRIASKIAAMLRHDFAATDVYLFGSVLRPGEFHALSDIDLAASGIASSDYLAAVYQALRLGGEFSVDLLDFSACRPALRVAIQREGVKL